MTLGVLSNKKAVPTSQVQVAKGLEMKVRELLMFERKVNERCDRKASKDAR